MIKVKDQKLGQNTRKSFSTSRFDYPLPNLVEIQTKSYEWFKKEGLMEVLRDASPITDTYGNLVIEFVSYTLDEEHPITQAGRPSALAIEENTLYFWAGDHLFRLAGNGRQIFQIDLSHDTLAVLPESDDEVMICTPAYAYRLNEKDFVRIEEP